LIFHRLFFYSVFIIIGVLNDLQFCFWFVENWLGLCKTSENVNTYMGHMPQELYPIENIPVLSKMSVSGGAYF
jgi:hypothetical protein